MGANEIDMAALDRDLKNLKKPQRGWFGRNWKWFVPFFILLLAVVGGGVAYYMIYQRVFNHEAYQQAMKKIHENKELKESLGEPITTCYKPGPSLRQDATETDIRWTIAGSSGKEAKAHVFKRLMNGKWGTVTSEVILPDKTTINLPIDEEGDLPPPFNPNAAPAADPNAAPPGKPTEENLPDDMTPKIPSADDSK